MNEGGRAAPVPLGRIFLQFLIIGGTSFGGAVPYLRGSLVTKLGWLDDKEFVELLSISQSLPGLNATNVTILVGQMLSGALGAIAAVLAISLPGGLLMFIVGIVYRAHGDHAWATAPLKGGSDPHDFSTHTLLGLILMGVLPPWRRLKFSKINSNRAVADRDETATDSSRTCLGAHVRISRWSVLLRRRMPRWPTWDLWRLSAKPDPARCRHIGSRS